MSLHWYACISTNTCCFETHHISLEMDWWALPNASSIVWIRSAVHEILADEAFTATDGLISQSFVVAFVHPTYMRIALIWGFPAQLSLWKSVYQLWRYKLNEVCDTILLLSIYLHLEGLHWDSNIWRYLSFIFDRKLLFCQHINFYTNKAILTVKCIKILRNFTWGLIPQQKQILYRSCILFMAFNYSSTIKYHYHILLRNLTKYNVKLPSGF